MKRPRDADKNREEVPFPAAKNRTNQSVVYNRHVASESFLSFCAPRPPSAPREIPVVGELIFVKRWSHIGMDRVAGLRGVAAELAGVDFLDQPDVLKQWNLDGVLRTFDRQFDPEEENETDIVVVVQGPTTTRNVFTPRPQILDTTWVGVVESTPGEMGTLPGFRERANSFFLLPFTTSQVYVTEGSSAPLPGSRVYERPKADVVRGFRKYDNLRMIGAWRLGKIVDTSPSPGQVTINVDISWFNTHWLEAVFGVPFSAGAHYILGKHGPRAVPSAMGPTQAQIDAAKKKLDDAARNLQKKLRHLNAERKKHADELIRRQHAIERLKNILKEILKNAGGGEGGGDGGGGDGGGGDGGGGEGGGEGGGGGEEGGVEEGGGEEGGAESIKKLVDSARASILKRMKPDLEPIMELLNLARNNGWDPTYSAEAECVFLLSAHFHRTDPENALFENFPRVDGLCRRVARAEEADVADLSEELIKAVETNEFKDEFIFLQKVLELIGKFYVAVPDDGVVILEEKTRQDVFTMINSCLAEGQTANASFALPQYVVELLVGKKGGADDTQLDIDPEVAKQAAQARIASSWAVPLILDAYRRSTSLWNDDVDDETVDTLADVASNFLHFDAAANMEVIRLVREFPGTIARNDAVGHVALAIFVGRAIESLFS